MEELKFASETEAMQYLSDLTGKRVKVAAGNLSDDEYIDDTEIFPAYLKFITNDIVSNLKKSLPNIKQKLEKEKLPELNIIFKSANTEFSDDSSNPAVYPFKEMLETDKEYFFIRSKNMEDFTDDQIQKISIIMADEMNNNISSNKIIKFKPNNAVRDKVFGFTILNIKDYYENYKEGIRSENRR